MTKRLTHVEADWLYYTGFGLPLSLLMTSVDVFVTDSLIVKYLHIPVVALCCYANVLT